MVRQDCGRVADWAGSSWAFCLAALVIIVWAVTGPVFGFSDTWQLVINRAYSDDFPSASAPC